MMKHDFTAEMNRLAAVVAKALSLALPPGFRGKLHVVVDSKQVNPHNVTVEFRPTHPQGGRAV